MVYLVALTKKFDKMFLALQKSRFTRKFNFFFNNKELCGEKSLWRSFKIQKSEMTVSKDFPLALSWCTPFFLSAQFSWRNLQNKMASFWRFWKNWKKPNFAAKNLCDKVSKIKNLRWQFCGIFRWLRHGLLCFFCRRCFHGEICKIKWPLSELISAVISRSFSLRNLWVTYD